MLNHLSGVSDLSASFSDYKNISHLVGYLHDIGKATNRFQNYLENGGERGEVLHSLQGAFYIDDITNNFDGIGNLLKEIVALTIAAHHGSLSDGVSPYGEGLFIDKLARKDKKEYYYLEIKQNITSDFSSKIKRFIEDAISEINSVILQIQEKYEKKESAQFALGLFVKYIYSCLIDADRLNAYLHEVNEVYKYPTVDWNNLIDVFEKNIRKFSSNSQIAKIRQVISEQCKESAKKSTGIYQLSVATGGGKTLSSFRFALHHCKKHDKQRIIYVIPYLSIIEQTSATLHNILSLDGESDVILEHHSNIVTPDNDENDDVEKQKIRKLATSRWESPIIITTMVQFLETIMSAKGSDLRKLHNMSDAVIIFDEIQSLPIKTVHLFNEVISFLAKMRNSTILLCTATQPRLHLTGRKNLLLANSPNLIDCDNLFHHFNRTSIIAKPEMSTDEFADFVKEKAVINGNCLVIVNTKKVARKIFEKLDNPVGFRVYHLSTSMCQEHRSIILDKVKKALDEKENIVCVATQLIEAGVDISFSCVIRASAGLDSVMQAAGRCNRNGESDIAKDVYIIPLRDENLDKLDDIKSGKEITARLIREYGGADLSDSKIMEKFYEYYFHNNENKMDYAIKDGKTIYDMLSMNRTGEGNYRNKTGKDVPCFVRHAFRTAAESFSVIDNKAESVVVMYGEAESLIEIYTKYPRNIVSKEKLTIIKKLEKFSVSLYAHEINNLTNKGAISIMDDESCIKYLSKLYYSKDVGVNTEIDPDTFII